MSTREHSNVWKIAFVALSCVGLASAQQRQVKQDTDYCQILVTGMQSTFNKIQTGKESIPEKEGVSLPGLEPGDLTAMGSTLYFSASDGARYRISPVLTWFPSEFSKIRLEYNYDSGQFVGSQHSVWMQVEFLLGAHGAHKF